MKCKFEGGTIIQKMKNKIKMSPFTGFCICECKNILCFSSTQINLSNLFFAYVEKG